jgi:choline-glycine betaine transporter
MRRWETLTALAAVVLASVGSIPAVPFRVALTAIAVVLVLIVGISRLIAALPKKTRQTPSSFDPAARAKMIRDARSKRK